MAWLRASCEGSCHGKTDHDIYKETLSAREGKEKRHVGRLAFEEIVATPGPH